MRYSGFLLQIIVLAVLLVLPSEALGQKRQRSKSKTKAKTTAVSKSKTSSTSKPKTSAEAKKKQAAAQKEIKLTEEQIRQNEAEVKRNLADLGKIDQEIQATNKNIKALDTRLAGINSQISSLEDGIASNEKDLEILRSEYLKAVKKMRVAKKNKSSMAFIFSSKSLNQALRRMRYLREFSAWRGRQTDEINAKNTDLKNQQDALAKAREEQESAMALLKTNKANLANQQSRQQGVVAKLKANGEALQVHLKKKQAEASELGNMVSQLIAEEQRKAAAEEEARKKALQEEEARRKAAQDEEKSPSTVDYASARKREPRGKKAEVSEKSATSSSSVKTPSSKTASSFQGMKGHLPYPTSGSFAVTSAFGRQSMPDLPDVIYDNPGIDAETEAGASAKAVYKGKVSGVYLLPGYNTVVIVNHGGYYTVYGNISSPSVKTGDSVEGGSELGKLALNDEDNSHSSIHFEVWKNREKLNPEEWLH